MKTAIAFRHSLKDGPNDTCGPKGLELAAAQGAVFFDSAFRVSKATHGVLVRTAQTLLAFLTAGPSRSVKILPPIAEFGSNELFAEMTGHSEFRERAKLAGNFRALIQCHGHHKCMEWAEQCAHGVLKFFDQLEEGETGVFVTHSPTLELALWELLGYENLPAEFEIFAEMEGVLILLVDGKFILGRKFGLPGTQIKTASAPIPEK